MAKSAVMEFRARYFSNGRLFGIHNPLDDDLGKAKDPLINLRTLLAFHIVLMWTYVTP
ncbi:MAG: hypothetical protein ABIJ10_00330 [Candidatus Micrarchaeota archaeon]